MTTKAPALVLAAAAIALAGAGPAPAQDYPTKDIRMIVPWGAGGGTDAIVRKISTIAEQDLPVAIYVENIEGGMSGTGLMQVMSARPDGYTLGSLTYDSVITVPWQGLVPGYGLDKLALIAQITAEPDALMVRTDGEYETYEDLIAAAKENPGEIPVGIQGLGSRVHLAMLQLQDQAGVEFQLVSYPGGAAPQKEALLNQEVDAVVTSLGDFASLIEEGDVKGVVEFSDTANPAYPDVPIAGDVGIDLQIGSFIILAAPAGTPDDIVAKLEEIFQAAHESEEFQSWLEQVGVTSSWRGTEEVTEWAKSTQDEYFQIMQGLVDEGIIKK
ncbi:MAG TPA: tripartite tricarboxylate transporter substrate binding protein [Geminicoccaceae bacterium]